MSVFVCRLAPPRPDLIATMSADEAAALQRHFAYWDGLVAAGDAVFAGSVDDPAGLWGMGIVEVSGPDEARRITDDDPIVTADLGFVYDILPVPQASLRPRPT